MTRVFWQLFLAMLGTFALFALLAWFLMQQKVADTESRRQEAMTHLTQIVADQVDQDIASKPMDARRFRQITRRIRSPLALSSVEGHVIGINPPMHHHIHQPSAPRQTHRQRPPPRSTPPPPLPTLKVIQALPHIQAHPLRNGDTLWVLPPPHVANPKAPWLHGIKSRITRLTAAGSLLFLSLLAVISALFVFPLLLRLSKRMASLNQSMQTFGAGALAHRSSVDGSDDVGKLAKQFNRMAAQVEQLVDEHQLLLAATSHELRSPLARLSMAADLLIDEPSAEKQHKWHAEMQHNIRELDALIGDILLSSRLQSAPNTHALKPMDVQALAEKERQYTEQARWKDPHHNQPVWVQGDATLAARAIRNLLNNAQRYGRPPPESPHEHIIELSLHATNQHWELWIEDRGTGIPEAWQTRIFQPFIRLPEHQNSQEGTGLGLNLVKRIAGLHGGVRYENRDGGGSRFILCFERCDAPSETH